MALGSMEPDSSRKRQSDVKMVEAMWGVNVARIRESHPVARVFPENKGLDRCGLIEGGNAGYRHSLI